MVIINIQQICMISNKYELRQKISQYRTAWQWFDTNIQINVFCLFSNRLFFCVWNLVQDDDTDVRVHAANFIASLSQEFNQVSMWNLFLFWCLYFRSFYSFVSDEYWHHITLFFLSICSMHHCNAIFVYK